MVEKVFEIHVKEIFAGALNRFMASIGNFIIQLANKLPLGIKIISYAILDNILYIRMDVPETSGSIVFAPLIPLIILAIKALVITFGLYVSMVVVRSVSGVIESKSVTSYGEAAEDLANAGLTPEQITQILGGGVPWTQIAIIGGLFLLGSVALYTFISKR